MENYFDEVREHIERAKTKKAIECLKEIIDKYDLDEKDSITILEGRYSKLKNDEVNGTQDGDTHSQELNKIHKGILDTIANLEREFKKIRSSTATDEFIKKIKSEDEFTFLLVGTTGVGKSSTINNLLGEQIAKVGDFEPTTMEVKHYRLPIDGYDFHVVDTPGLCDDLPEVGNDQKYIDLMINGVKHVDALLYVSNLGDTRVRSDEKRGIKLITESFGQEIWKNSIIVFTFSNIVPSNKFSDALKIRTKLIKKAIEESGVVIEVSQRIPSVAIDNLSLHNPDGKEWLGELYTCVAEKVTEKGFAKFMMGTIKRVEVETTKKIRSNSSSNNNITIKQNINISRDQEKRITKAAEQKGFFDRASEYISTRVVEPVKQGISRVKKWLFG